jgi:hypothetical protein
MNDPETIGSYIRCLSTFETETAQLYRTLAEKVNMPLAKGLIQGLSHDSQKHAQLLKTISECVKISDKKTREFAKKLKEVSRILGSFSIEIQAREKITATEFPRIAENLAILESSFGEEYTMLMQMDTMKYLVEEINERYNVGSDQLQNFFWNLIAEQVHQKEILATVKALLNQNEKTPIDSTPAVKYQNPDSWNHPMPTATYNSS